MVREAAEEVGLRVEAGRLVGVYADPAVTLVTVDGQYQKQFIAAVFRVDRYLGEPVYNDEVDAMDWFSADRLPGPMLPSHPPRVADVFADRAGVFVR